MVIFGDGTFKEAMKAEWSDGISILIRKDTRELACSLSPHIHKEKLPRAGTVRRQPSTSQE